MRLDSREDRAKLVELHYQLEAQLRAGVNVRPAPAPRIRRLLGPPAATLPLPDLLRRYEERLVSEGVLPPLGAGKSQK